MVTGASRLMTPSTSRMTAIATSGFVTEAWMRTDCGVTGRAASTQPAKALAVDDLSIFDDA